MFKNGFDRYACVGDTIYCCIDGEVATASIEFDHDTTPDDSCVMSADDRVAWEDDEWFYCGIVVRLGGREASLWGVECNHPAVPGNGYLTEVANDLLKEITALEPDFADRVRDFKERNSDGHY